MPDDVKPPHTTPAPFPRLAHYETIPPDVTQQDPLSNAHDLRHAVKGRLNIFRLVAACFRRDYATMNEEQRADLVDTLDRAIADVQRDVDLVRILPPQPSKEA